MSRGQKLALLAIAALALWLRWWPDGSITAGRAFLRHDEQHYVDLARELLNGRFTTNYFINPALFGYLLAGTSALLGLLRVALGVEPGFAHFVARETMNPWLIVLVGRALSMAASVACVLVVARLGRRLFSPGVGLAAALALALDGLAIGRAPLCGNESLTTLLALLAIDAVAAREAVAGSWRRRAVAGVLLGLATATKYSAGIFGLTFVVALGRRVGPALVGAAVGFALGAPSTWLRFREFLSGFTTQAAFLHEGYRPEDAAVRANGWLFYARTFAATHQGVLFAAAIAIGIIGALIAAPRRDARAQRLLLSASLPLFLFLGSGIFLRERFLLPATPFLLLHGAWLLHAVVERFARRVPSLQSRTPLTTAALLLIVAAAAGPSAATQRPLLARVYGRPDAASDLFEQLRPALRRDETTFEFTLQLSDELLIDADPWRELHVASPSLPLREEVIAELDQRGLLPGARSLRSLFGTATSLADLQRDLAASGARSLVVVLPARAFATEEGLLRANRDPPFRDCAWWADFVRWLSALPRRTEAASRDGSLIAAVLELPS